MEVFFVNYDFLKDLSVDNLMQFDQKIASFTRHSGTDEEYQAFLYMKEKYESFGYRTELVLHDAYISLPVSAKAYGEWDRGICPDTFYGSVDSDWRHFRTSSIRAGKET